MLQTESNEKIQNFQAALLALDKLQADIANQQSETARNIPEMEHLKSETILNLLEFYMYCKRK